MNKHLAGLLGLAAGVALATDWRPVFVSPSGQWDVKPGSVLVRQLEGAPQVTAYVRLTAVDEPTVYLGAVPVAHCGKSRGDVQLLTADGRPHWRAVFVGDGTTVADALARELCKVRP